METWDEIGRPDVVQPKSDTTTSVFDGGGDNIHETPVASAADNRPITRRAYIIRVDHMKTTVPPLSTTDTPSCVYDSVSEYATEAGMDTGNERERPGVGQPTSDTTISVFDGGGVPTHGRPSASVADSEQVRTCTVRLNDMRNINNLLKDRRDRLNVDKLKLCSGATQSDDDVADE